MHSLIQGLGGGGGGGGVGWVKGEDCAIMVRQWIHAPSVIEVLLNSLRLFFMAWIKLLYG